MGYASITNALTLPRRAIFVKAWLFNEGNGKLSGENGKHQPEVYNA
jgi:hypothetical protein